MVGLLDSTDQELMGLAARGLANFAYTSSLQQRRAVMGALPGATRVKAIVEGRCEDEVKVTILLPPPQLPRKLHRHQKDAGGHISIRRCPVPGCSTLYVVLSSETLHLFPRRSLNKPLVG